ncbi:MAG: ImmA/IrrE family metallo-endopeptidase [Wenzhouxiangella sp.]|nr:ImmA/IrrE family metallo-endopeptidase [Wenzhouxiangella sp.]MCH8479011.1 XRE family transcriptional regulator [Wenzhouxiangella sp.]
MDATRIRRRIVALRQRAGMKQVDLARALGVKDRQIISNIETGERKVSADELVRLADIFDVELAVFSDPYRIVDEASFSWRRSEIPEPTIQDFENQAKNWLALYRHLSRTAGEPVNSLVPKLDLTERSSFEDAASEGESIAAQFDLGAVPALSLEQALDEKLNVLVLQVDAPDGISGAACRLGGLNFVLVNRRESPARRVFNLAHELFHLATWEQMPPEHIESVRVHDNRNPRPEQLANAFASGLLMPRRPMEALIEQHPKPEAAEFTDWIQTLAQAMGVSGQAMKWRLVDLGQLPRAKGQRIDDESLRQNYEGTAQDPLPFSPRFVERLRWGLDEGRLTVRRAAGLMGMTIDQLHSLFVEHDVPVPFDL